MLFRKDERDFKAVVDIRFPRFPFLPGVRPIGKLICFANQGYIDVGVERFNLDNELRQIQHMYTIYEALTGSKYSLVQIDRFRDYFFNIEPAGPSRGLGGHAAPFIVMGQ